ncbi:limbic system-associated membrane protein-like isoform X2 [Dreissena polymorpha]|uniref:limbic system-associated membrane protein-like isoform X2 n=1 Tax=Dreissena polymorpha TaxID=45954 RepID=UPI0022643E6C|nr:limbic system-associated membrane protein-like isoform X2 [Dreissena polymorpha]
MQDYRMIQVGFVIASIAGVFGVEPSFDVPVINVTVQEGDMAVLPCSVDFLGEHKVVWTDQWSTLLTLDDRRIIDDPRISIERPYTRDWNLHIRKALYGDRGQYTCQINTNPVKTKTVMLFVLVPSKIVDHLSTRDATAKEGETVTLVCNVTGVPTPEVTWYKLPNEGLQTRERIGTAGEVLIIHNVSRYCDGSYECVAYNNVDPAVTRKIKVFVEFAPEVTLPTKRIGQLSGRETILDCEITAYPHGLAYWMKDNDEIDLTRKEKKYEVEMYSGTEDSTKKTLSLRVKNIEHGDYGEYTCYAQNRIGRDQDSMILYDYSINTKPKTTTQQPRLIYPTPQITNNIPLKPGQQQIFSVNGPGTSSGNTGFNGGDRKGSQHPRPVDKGPNNHYQPSEETLPLGSRTGSTSVTSRVHVIGLITSLFLTLLR